MSTSLRLYTRVILRWHGFCHRVTYKYHKTFIYIIYMIIYTVLPTISHPHRVIWCNMIISSAGEFPSIFPNWKPHLPTEKKNTSSILPAFFNFKVVTFPYKGTSKWRAFRSTIQKWKELKVILLEINHPPSQYGGYLGYPDFFSKKCVLILRGIGRGYDQSVFVSLFS